MLTLAIDMDLIIDFYQSYIVRKKFESLDDAEFEYFFFKFLKAESNLEIYNYREKINDIDLNKILTQFTTGRGNGNTMRFANSFAITKNWTLNQDQNYKKCFFLKESNPDIHILMRINNGNLFSFNEEYRKSFEQLSLLKQNKTLLVRKEETRFSFRKWGDLSKYLLPFTDMVLVDNYIFNNEPFNYEKYNLIPLLKILQRSKKINYNLLIVSYEGTDRKIKVSEVYSNLLQIRKESDLKFNLGVFIATNEFKEHDRGIFMNYLRIRSGDSFSNYFDNDGQIKTVGTELNFLPYTESINAIISEEILRDIKLKIDKSIRKNKYCSAGNISNRLLGD